MFTSLLSPVSPRAHSLVLNFLLYGVYYPQGSSEDAGKGTQGEEPWSKVGRCIGLQGDVVAVVRLPKQGPYTNRRGE